MRRPQGFWFCWLTIHYDIRWNPVRLDQRMGRIHRYGQGKDCLIITFVASNTREGRVMGKLFEPRLKTYEAGMRSCSRRLRERLGDAAIAAPGNSGPPCETHRR